MPPKKRSKPLRAILEEQLSKTRKEIKRLQSKADRFPYEDAKLVQLKMHREARKKALRRMTDDDQ